MFKVTHNIKIDALSNVWEKIPTKFISILNINLKGTDIIVSPQKQFNIYYRDRTLIYTDREEAEDAFIMIFFGNKAQFMLKQIELTENELLDRISDLNIWCDVTKVEMENKGNRTNQTNTENLTLNRSGNTDSNSMMDKLSVDKHFNLTEDSPIVPNLLSQTINNDKSRVDMTEGSEGTTQSNTTFSNESEDIIKYINIDLPDLRQKFWSLFHSLFTY